MVNFIDRFILFILFLHISYSYDSKLPLLLEKSCFKTLYMKNLLLDRTYSEIYDLSVNFSPIIKIKG